MEHFQKRSLVTGRSLRYTYYTTTSGESTRTNPALVFVHGWPDSAHLWREVVSALRDPPNKIIIPDCLGYASTDKPTDIAMYAYKDQAADFVDILGNESVESAILIGHDWGSALAQRIYLHHRHLFSGLVLLNTGYMVPSDQPFDLATVNELTMSLLGYPQFSYWEFLTSDDAGSIIDARLDRMWQALHGDVDDWMKKLFCVPGAMREFVTGDEQVPLKAFARKAEWKDAFMQQFKDGGFGAALSMYNATVSNLQTQSDLELLGGNLAIEVPLLYIVCSKDAVCVPAMMEQAKQEGLVPKLKEVVLDAAHWSPMEKPNEIAYHIREFMAVDIV